MRGVCGLEHGWHLVFDTLPATDRFLSGHSLAEPTATLPLRSDKLKRERIARGSEKEWIIKIEQSNEF